MSAMNSHRWSHLAILLLALCAGGIAATASPAIIISVPDQQMVVIDNGVLVGHFPVSTSKYGVGDRPRSFATPLGTLAVAAKVGAGAPEGAVFKGQHFTGEIVRPNSSGRDPIVTRILHLRGLDACNARAYDRGIYIHGTPEEWKIGHPASYGCVRMRSRDVVRVFDAVPVGTRIEILNMPLRRVLTDWALNQGLSQARTLAAK